MFDLPNNIVNTPKQYCLAGETILFDSSNTCVWHLNVKIVLRFNRCLFCLTFIHSWFASEDGNSGSIILECYGVDMPSKWWMYWGMALNRVGRMEEWCQCVFCESPENACSAFQLVFGREEGHSQVIRLTLWHFDFYSRCVSRMVCSCCAAFICKEGRNIRNLDTSVFFERTYLCCRTRIYSYEQVITDACGHRGIRLHRLRPKERQSVYGNT